MKKIYSLVILSLLFVVGNLQAQRAWECSETNAEVILPGEENYYVIQEGIGNPRMTKQGYLNSGGGDVLQNINDLCIYNFIAVDKMEVDGETYDIYVLKNVNNQMYLRGDGNNGYTDIMAKAYKFTLRKAKEYKTDDPEVDFTDWRVYSHAVEGFKANGDEGINAGAEALGAWVFCSSTEQLYLDYQGNPAMSNAHYRNNWFIFSAKPQEMSAYEKLMSVFDLYFSDFSEEKYPIGKNPGCISQELFDEIKAVYDEAVTASANPELAPAECDRIRESIINVFDKYDKGLVRLAQGYYMIRSERASGFAYDNKSVYFKGNVEVPESWTLDDAAFIWKFTTSEEPNGFYIQNYVTNRYIGSKSGEKKFITTEEPKTSIFFENPQGVIFYMKDNINYANCNPKMEMVHYGKDEGGKLQLIYVDSIVVDTLQAKVDQEYMNQQLKSLLRKSHYALEGIEYKNGFTLNGDYQKKAVGLVDHFVRCNATETTEGSEAGAFDGNLQTYYHTNWHTASAPKDDWHWAQVDLGKELQSFVLKLSKRHNGNSHTPTRLALVASADSLAEVWSDTVYQDTVIYAYSTPYAAGDQDSTTCIQKITLDKPVRYLRFVVKHTQNNVIKNYGPCWNISELRFYDPAECMENPRKNMLPAQVMNDLKAAMDAADAELEMGKGTQATYDVLEAALDAMWEAYPNPEILTRSLERAQYRLEVAQEGEELGYYQNGAKAEFEKALLAISEEVGNEEKVLTLDEIKQLEERLSGAIKAFNSKLNVPENGVYRIICKAVSENEEQEDPAFDSYVASVNADVASSPVWGYKADNEIETRWNTLWKLEKAENGMFSLKNLANGLYMDNPYEGLSEEDQKEIGITTSINYSETPKYMALEASPISGQFMLTLKDNMFVNASGKQSIGGVGSPLAIWNDYKDGSRSRFIFEDVVDGGFSGESFKLNAPAKSLQILSLPIALQAVYAGEAGTAYEVLGVKDNMLQLVESTGEIAAGAPFIVMTGEAIGEGDMDLVELVPVANSIETLESSAYNYNVVVKNGLVSAPRTVAPGDGYGFFYDNVLTLLEQGDEVAAGSGFFNKDIPATEQTGDLSVKIEGVISGEGTAVENVIFNKKVSNAVYSLSGVKVRENVKAGTATEGLPKGVYIVDGNKVIVK